MCVTKKMQTISNNHVENLTLTNQKHMTFKLSILLSNAK